MSTRSNINGRFTWKTLLDFPARIALAWQHRRVVGRLGALDDHLLADIGITRQDVISVLAESLFVDASEKLAKRATDTRQARHAMTRDLIRSQQAFAPDVGDDRRAA